MRRCIIENCNNVGNDLKGMCGKHAQRVRRYGDPYYVTSEQKRRESNRISQLKRFEGEELHSYPKLLGRHEHRIVAEEMLGRLLRKGEIVHHKDHDKRNNDPSNLEVMTQSEHCRKHGFGKFFLGKKRD